MRAALFAAAWLLIAYFGIIGLLGTEVGANPTNPPSKSPTTSVPSKSPTTSVPSKSPSTKVPSKSPTTKVPSKSPSKSPSRSPTSKSPSKSPSRAPISSVPTASPFGLCGFVNQNPCPNNQNRDVVMILDVGYSTPSGHYDTMLQYAMQYYCYFLGTYSRVGLILMGSQAVAAIPVQYMSQDMWRAALFNFMQGQSQALQPPAAGTGFNPLFEAMLVAFQQLKNLSSPNSTSSIIQIVTTNLPFPLGIVTYNTIPGPWRPPNTPSRYVAAGDTVNSTTAQAAGASCTDTTTNSCAFGSYGVYSYETYTSVMIPTLSSRLKTMGASINVLLMQNIWSNFPNASIFNGVAGGNDASAGSPCTRAIDTSCVGKCDTCSWYQYNTGTGSGSYCYCVSSTNVPIGSQNASISDWNMTTMLGSSRVNTCRPTLSPTKSPTVSPTKTCQFATAVWATTPQPAMFGSGSCSSLSSPTSSITCMNSIASMLCTSPPSNIICQPPGMTPTPSGAIYAPTMAMIGTNLGPTFSFSSYPSMMPIYITPTPNTGVNAPIIGYDANGDVVVVATTWSNLWNVGGTTSNLNSPWTMLQSLSGSVTKVWTGLSWSGAGLAPSTYSLNVYAGQAPYSSSGYWNSITSGAVYYDLTISTTISAGSSGPAPAYRTSGWNYGWGNSPSPVPGPAIDLVNSVPASTGGIGLLCFCNAHVCTRSPTSSPQSSKPSRSPTRSPFTTYPSASPTSSRPSNSPSSRTPSRSPSVSPNTQFPSRAPSSQRPSQSPSVSPTSSRPSNSPLSRMPSRSPSVSPNTQLPSRAPSYQRPSRSPTLSPTTQRPSASPATQRPSQSPSFGPTTQHPSRSPSASPASQHPSRSPSSSPTTQRPTRSPSASPTTQLPTLSPVSRRPSNSPTTSPTTQRPSRSPSSSPSSKKPSRSPSSSPSGSPSVRPSVSPTSSPATQQPSHSPTRSPVSHKPSKSPSRRPSKSPSRKPSRSPTSRPSASPSESPSQSPRSSNPSRAPSRAPSGSPTRRPSSSPTYRGQTLTPSRSPISHAPSTSPVTRQPTKSPTRSPSRAPTIKPTRSPTMSRPTSSPSSSAPSLSPTATPTEMPSSSPTQRPSFSPTRSPTHFPSKSPTRSPTTSPTSKRPSFSPSSSPTSSRPSRSPTGSPTSIAPTSSPTSSSPSLAPSRAPSTEMPSTSPSRAPSQAPTKTLFYLPNSSVSRRASTNVMSNVTFIVQPNYPCTIVATPGCDQPGWLAVLGPPAQQVFDYPAQVPITIVFNATGNHSFSPFADASTISTCLNITAVGLAQSQNFTALVPVSVDFFTSCPPGSFSNSSTNIQGPCKLCAAGGYESTSFAQVGLSCENLTCAEEYFCGKGAVEGQNYRRMIEFGPFVNTLVVGATRQLALTVFNVDPLGRSIYIAPLAPDSFGQSWVTGLFLSDGVTPIHATGVIIGPGGNESIQVNVDANGLPVSALSSSSSSFFGSFPLTWWSDEDLEDRFIAAVSTTINIVTVLVTPSVFSYTCKSGQIYSSNSTTPLSPSPVVNIFNNLCNNAISYMIEPCQSDAAIPSWFVFDAPIGIVHSIPQQQGLPDALPFHLDFTGSINEDLVSQATDTSPILSFCFVYNVDLIGIGTNVTVPVVVNVTATVSCPVGYYSPSGDNSNGCLPCQIGTYQNATGQTTCISCSLDAPQTLGNASTSITDCVAAPGSFLLPNSTVQAACPPQAFCNGTGTTLETLYLKPGYWRTYQGSTQYLQCPQPQFCVGGYAPPVQINFLNYSASPNRRALAANNMSGVNASSLCYPHSTGILCQQCEPGYVHRGPNRYCQVCTPEATYSDQSRIAGIMIGISLAAVLLAVYVGLRLFFSHSKPKPGALNLVRQTSKRIDAVLLTIDGGTKLKIIIGLIQVVSGMSIAFAAVLPPQFLQITAIFSVLALDLIAIFDFGCALADQSHYISLLLTTLLPMLVCLFIVACYLVFNKIILKRPDQAELRTDIRTLCYTLFLLTLFLVYPSVSGSILKTWQCDTFDDGTTWLRVDHTISCQIPKYQEWLVYSVLMFFIYVVGVPVTYSRLLNSQRRQLNPPYARQVAIELRKGDPQIQHLKFLWEPYRPQFYWFEVWELIRKLIQTSVLVFVASGSSLQMIFQLGVTLVSVFILHVMRPYIQRGDLYLALLAQWAIFAISFLSLLIKLDSAANIQEYNTAALQEILLIIFLSVPVVACIQLLFNMALSHPGRKLASRLGLKRARLRAIEWMNRHGWLGNKDDEDRLRLEEAEKLEFSSFKAKVREDPVSLEAFFLENRRCTLELEAVQTELKEARSQALELSEQSSETNRVIVSLTTEVARLEVENSATSKTVAKLEAEISALKAELASGGGGGGGGGNTARRTTLHNARRRTVKMDAPVIDHPSANQPGNADAQKRRVSVFDTARAFITFSSSSGPARTEAVLADPEMQLKDQAVAEVHEQATQSQGDGDFDARDPSVIAHIELQQLQHDQVS